MGYFLSPDMASIGNNIYFFSGLSFSMNTSTAALLGHETIHNMQFEALGGYSGMVSGYQNNMVGMESEAYWFGGHNRRLSPPGDPFLKTRGYDWWAR
jgi:hypothetical protein